MTRKHFQAIAADIKRQVLGNMGISGDPLDRHVHNVLESLAHDLCGTFRTINSNFDSARFLQACGF